MSHWSQLLSRSHSYRCVAAATVTKPYHLCSLATVLRARSRAEPAPSPRTPRNTITSITATISVLRRSTDCTPKILPAIAAACPPPNAAVRVAAIDSMTITRIGAPMAPAIWRTVFVTADPAATSCEARQFNDHVVTGISTNPMPIWRVNWQIDTHQIHV